MKYSFYVGFLAAFFCLDSTESYSVEVDDIEDAMVFNQEPDSNYQNTSSAQHLLAIRNPLGGGYTKMSFIKFDLSAIDDHILSATLNLNFMKTESRTGSWLFQVSKVDENSWKEDLITWNTRPEAGEVLSEVVFYKPDPEDRFYIEVEGQPYVKYENVPIQLNLDFNDVGNTLSIAYRLAEKYWEGRRNFGGVGFFTKEHASPLARGPFLDLQTVPYPPSPEDVVHQVHLSGEQGDMDLRCTGCHAPVWDESFATLSMNLDPESCNGCHSPGGFFDGVNDPVIGALNNIDTVESTIYDANGILLPGKEAWCLTCHDDGHSTVNGVSAPNIAGKSINGPWKNPVGVVENGFTSADALVDGDLFTGNDAGETDDLIFDLGSEQVITHIRMYTSGQKSSFLQVYGSTDQVQWKRMYYGNAVRVARPFWNVTEEGWVETRIDDFSPVRYVKLVRASKSRVLDRIFREFEYKSDFSYGYLVSGHKVACDYCHDTTGLHTDGLSRTYTAAQKNYSLGYRLADVVAGTDSVPALEVPREDCNDTQQTRFGNDFALCFTCHDKYNLLGDGGGTGDFLKNPLQTFFMDKEGRDKNGNIRNSHLRHLRGKGYCGNVSTWDSDWDGIEDSPISCAACHNVHGSPSPAMMRHGELVSTPGTTDKVPMLNFVYLDAGGVPNTDMMDRAGSTGAKTQFYRAGPGSVGKNHSCKMCHNDQTSYQRTP